jgi:hypothetical protein
MPDQEWQPPNVIEVGMTQDDRVDPAGVEREVAIECRCLGAMALEHASVEENPSAGGFEQMHRAGDLARGAPEGELRAQWSGPELRQWAVGIRQ